MNGSTEQLKPIKVDPRRITPADVCDMDRKDVSIALSAIVLGLHVYHVYGQLLQGSREIENPRLDQLDDLPKYASELADVYPVTKRLTEGPRTRETYKRVWLWLNDVEEGAPVEFRHSGDEANMRARAAVITALMVKNCFIELPASSGWRKGRRILSRGAA